MRSASGLRTLTAVTAGGEPPCIRPWSGACACLLPGAVPHAMRFTGRAPARGTTGAGEPPRLLLGLWHRSRAGAATLAALARVPVWEPFTAALGGPWRLVAGAGPPPMGPRRLQRMAPFRLGHADADRHGERGRLASTVRPGELVWGDLTDRGRCDLVSITVS
jgi:hypothetical protein